jgi:hypothetical protein
VKLKGYKVVTHTDTNNLYLQPSIKGTKDLDIELEDHITVRDYIAGELTRHIGLADSLFSSEEVLASPTRQSSVDFSSSPLFKPRPGRAANSSNNNLASLKKSPSPEPTAEVGNPSSSEPVTPATPASPAADASQSPSKPLAVNTAPPEPEPEPESVDVKEPPSALKFWAQKKGHVNVGMKPRYFVVHGGTLNYYLSESDTPPFGKDLKGYDVVYSDLRVAGVTVTTEIQNDLSGEL